MLWYAAPCCLKICHFLLQLVQLGPEIRMACTGMCTHSRKVRVLGICREESINFTLGRLRSFHFLSLVPFCRFHSADYLHDAVNKLFISYSKIYCGQKLLIPDLLLLHACLFNLQVEGVSPLLFFIGWLEFSCNSMLIKIALLVILRNWNQKQHTRVITSAV